MNIQNQVPDATFKPEPLPNLLRDRRKSCLAGVPGWVVLGMALWTSCATPPKMPPADLGEPGWTVRHGQVLWRSSDQDQGMAGDLIMAIHQDGRRFVQFSKTPFPWVTAQSTPTNWQLELALKKRILRGRTPPPSRLVWLQLPACFLPEGPAAPWTFSTLGGAQWLLRNPETQESLRGYWMVAP